MFSLISFFLSFFRRALSFFSGLPGKIAILVSSLGAVVLECRSFVSSLSPYFDGVFNSLSQYLSQFAVYFQGSDTGIFQMFVYCTALDTLVGVVVSAVGFMSVVLSFLLVSFLHVVFAYFGLKFGHSVYKALLSAASNGLAKV